MLVFFFFSCIEQLLCSLICSMFSEWYFFCNTYGASEVNLIVCYMTSLSMHSHVACTFTPNYSGKLGFFFLVFLNIVHNYCLLRFSIFSVLVLCIGSNALRNSRIYLEQGNKLRGSVWDRSNMIKRGSVVYWTVQYFTGMCPWCHTYSLEIKSAHKLLGMCGDLKWQVIL